MKRYDCGNVVALLMIRAVHTFMLAIRRIFIVFTEKDMFNWKDDWKETALTDEEVSYTAGRACPACKRNDEDEAEEIGYHAVFEKKVFRCRKCEIIFLDAAENSVEKNIVLGDRDKENIVSIQ